MAEVKFEPVVQRIDPRGRLLRRWPLTGGISAQVTALEMMLADGQTRKLIVRQHGAADLRQNPHIAGDEFRLLTILQSEGIAAPTPYDFDESGVIFPTPYIVVEYMEGEPEFAPADVADFIQQLAMQLARIHRVARPDLAFLPSVEDFYTKKLQQRPAQPDDSLDEGRIRATLEAVWPLPQHNQSALLHGDFWPGNILWRDGKLAAVIDWEDAKVGDPLADLGNTRLEILWVFGRDAMTHFTQRYQTEMTAVNFANLPYWDLCAALRPASKIAEWAGGETRERLMRERHKWFVTQAYLGLQKI